MENFSNNIYENSDLLKKLIADSKNIDKIFQPSPYWKKKVNNSYYQILKHGISNFRHHTNSIGESYSDNQNINILNDFWSLKRKIIRFLFSLYPINRIHNRQLHLTNYYRIQSNIYKSKYFKSNKEVINLLNKYKFDDTVLFGCCDFIDFNGKNISTYYLNIANIHENFSKKISFQNYKTFFEIGGGFGANIHFLIQNYSNIRKFIYLDLPINLYVATQYLKSFYKENVKDYLMLKNKRINFSNNDELEIFCIPPWKISEIDTSYDIFQNSSSFIEMSDDIVKFYAEIIENLKKKNSKILLSSYLNDKYDSTLNPYNLDNFFKTSLEKFESSSLIPDKKDIYFISK